MTPELRPAEALGAEIDAYIQDNRAAIVSDLQKIITFKTISGGKNDEERQAWRQATRDGFEWIGQRARALGLEFRNLDNIVAVVELPGAQSAIGVLLHLDVVPPGEGWTHPPFQGAIDEGVVYGRGCQDDKGPIIQALHAMAALKALGRPLAKSIRVIIGSEEETGVWADIDYYLKNETPPELSIVPDSVFPVVNGEKGMADLVFEAPGEITAQAAPLRLRSLSGGERPNIVPPHTEAILEADTPDDVERLQAALTEFLEANPKAKADFQPDHQGEQQTVRIVFHGTSSHGSRPQKGHNAARDALAFVAGLEGLGGVGVEFAREISSVIVDDSGQAMGIANAHDFIGSTTQNLGILRIDSEQLHAMVNIRHTPPQTCQSLLADVQAHCGDKSIKARIEAKAYDPLFLDPEEHPEFINALQRAYLTVTGREPELRSMGGTTFAKAFPNAICFGPTDLADEEDLAHQVDERVHVDHHLRNVRIYGLALGLLALAAPES